MHLAPRIEPNVMTSSPAKSELADIYASCAKCTCEGISDAFRAFDTLMEKSNANDTGENSIVPDLKLLNYIVYCWSESSHVPSDLHSEAVFHKLQSYHLKDLNPDARTYNLVIHSLVQRILDQSQIPRLIDCIFNYMETQSETVSICSPNASTFSTCINILSKCGLPEAPRQAEKFLEKMTHYYNNEKCPSPPTQSLYTLVLKAWSNSGLKIAGEGAENVLYQMEKSNIPGIYPDTIAFGAVLNTWGKLEDFTAANRAFTILKHMEARYKIDKKNAKPNTYCYTTVIDAFGRIGKAVEAERVLKRLLEAYFDSNDPDLQPDAVAFLSAINAWSKRGGYEGATKAESLLGEMQKLYLSTKNELLAPQTIPFSSVLHAWARSREKIAPHRAETILMMMQDLYESGCETVRPNRISYSTVIDCWAKSKEVGSAKRAEALLNKLDLLYKQTGDIELRPNTITFTSVMDAWAKSREEDSVLHVEAILRRMELMYESGAKYAKPNAYSYTIVLGAFAADSKANEKTIEKSFAILNKMKSLEKLGQVDMAPTTKTYGNVIRIIANRRGKHDNAKQVTELVQEMKTRGLKIDEFSLSYACLACARTRGPRNQQNAAFVAAKSFFREMLDTVKSPSAASFTNFILACCGNNQQLAEEAYVECCKLGYGRDVKVMRAVKRAAPHVLRSF
mmetsp:Transcript_33288/g.50208  ORF Transcript_33288/g.50208 Transcript_33288/m.50208 type:complete len:679 (-) Transcript_33288:171-2207(-)